MTLSKLLDFLGKIRDTHPEVADAEVWAGKGKDRFRIMYVGLDQRHKPARIKLEQ